MANNNIDFVAFLKLVRANKDKTFEIETDEGDILDVKYDSDFLDDENSLDSSFLEKDQAFQTIVFTIFKVKKDVTSKYEKGYFILINPFNMVKNYKVN
jgi:hypothetical protein